MKPIYCLDDRGGWGRALSAEAHARGWQRSVFADLDDILLPSEPLGYAFLRIDQTAAQQEKDKDLAVVLNSRGFTLIPDIDVCLTYEDKLAQAERYAQWMPKTLVLRDEASAINAIEYGVFDYPFISKSRTGSASKNVRMILNKEQALREIDAAFHAGLSAPHRLGEITQHGYLIWQEFLPGNAYDYRVVVTGTRHMILQRHNKPGTVFASGSGINNPVELTDEVISALAFAELFFSKNNMKWGGIDIVQDHSVDGPFRKWRVLETTLGWSQSAYAKCKYYGTGLHGADIWKVLCNEIEEGVFE